MGIVIGVLEQGFIYGIMALGVYITYKILDFPDLTVDGSFPLGAAVTAVLLSNGFNPYLAVLLSFFTGILAGICTGLIHVKLKVRDLLSGIIMMTALFSINLRIAGRANVPLYKEDTVFQNDFLDGIFAPIKEYQVVLIALAFVLFAKLLLDLYLKTKSGFLLRAVGDNQTLVTSLAKDQGLVKIIGLAIANGLVAMSGSLLCQQQRFFESSMGTGVIIIGLASVIIGINVFKNFTLIKATLAVIIGSVIYRACLALAIMAGLSASDLKLITASLFLIILVITMDRKKRAKGNA